MKFPLLILIGVLGLGTGPAAMAEETLQSSRSAGKLRQDQTVDLSARLRQLEPVVRERPSESENYAASEAAARNSGIANRHDQLFSIYDANVDLLADDDGDGYHHALNVYFDVDVSYDSATVYAKLYLSREGGPWIQYYTTDLFTIHGDLYSDAYEVETELIEGYPEGYYAVLVEIYSLDHADMVASEVLDYHYLGKDIMLEDLHRDTPFDDFHGELSVSVEGSAASMDLAMLLSMFLIIQLVIAARGFLASPPLKSEIEEEE